jgi:hypothetical protein
MVDVSSWKEVGVTKDARELLFTDIAIYFLKLCLGRLIVTFKYAF